MATLGSLNDRVASIQSRADFAGFVRDLRDDLRAHPGRWENPDLATFLEALAAWVEDCEGYYRNRGEAAPERPDWKFLGEALMAASVYE